jgi:hypothetical protein
LIYNFNPLHHQLILEGVNDLFWALLIFRNIIILAISDIAYDVDVIAIDAYRVFQLLPLTDLDDLRLLRNVLINLREVQVQRVRRVSLWEIL